MSSQHQEKPRAELVRLWQETKRKRERDSETNQGEAENDNDPVHEDGGANDG